MVSRAVDHENIAWNTPSGMEATSRLSNDVTNANHSCAFPTRSNLRSGQDPPLRISPGNDSAKSHDEDAGSDTGDNEKGGRCWTKFIMALLILGVVTATIVDLACHDNVRSWLEDCFQWIEDNPKGGESHFITFSVLDFYMYCIRVPRSNDVMAYQPLEHEILRRCQSSFERELGNLQSSQDRYCRAR